MLAVSYLFQDGLIVRLDFAMAHHLFGLNDAALHVLGLYVDTVASLVRLGRISLLHWDVIILLTRTHLLNIVVQ